MVEADSDESVLVSWNHIGDQFNITCTAVNDPTDTVLETASKSPHTVSSLTAGTQYECAVIAIAHGVPSAPGSGIGATSKMSL